MRVLITADLATARRQLQEITQSAGHTVLDSADLGAGALLASAEWEVDAVVVGLFARRPPQQRSAVLVETGIALGRGTPVLLLTREGLLVPALTGVPQIDARLDDPETLALKLELFFQGVYGGVPRRPADKTEISRRQGHLPGGYPDAMELERTVAELFAANGFALVPEPNQTSPRGRPDLAVYAQGHEAELGLVLIEVKQIRSPQWQRRIRDASQELSRHVVRAHAAFGLVIYDGDGLPPQQRTKEPLVVAISLAALKLELEQRQLQDIVRRLRNEAIHGL
ncbi:hypothetical protein ACXYX3_00150 [Mycobacterium sp. C3-094]